MVAKQIKEKNEILRNEGTNKRKRTKKVNYYQKSLNALISKMEKSETNPNEKKWDVYAVKNKYLSSKTLGYLSGIGFNKLCRKIRKEINQKKKHI